MHSLPSWILNHWLTQEKFWIAAGAIATFSVAFIALFQEKIKAKFNQSKLDATINLTPPDSHKIKQWLLGNISRDVIYVRVKIKHIGGDPGKNVEVMILECRKVEKGNKVTNNIFLPLNLKWANQPDGEVVSKIKVPSNLFRFWDLGYLYKKGSNTRFHFDTIVDPNGVGDEGDLPNIIGKGKYEIELRVSGDNTKTISKRWRMEIDGIWDESEEIMLRDHLKITEI